MLLLLWASDSGRGPRILKLHGDLTRGQLVLSRGRFISMHAFRRPLPGVRLWEENASTMGLTRHHLAKEIGVPALVSATLSMASDC